MKYETPKYEFNKRESLRPYVDSCPFCNRNTKYSARQNSYGEVQNSYNGR
jgi:hypothetical protein